MASLNAHLRQPGDHGRLGFHAGCPVCREERLLGTLSAESALSRRAQAALATGAVAVSLAVPPAGWGQEPDSRQEGVSGPREPTGGPAVGAPGEPEAPTFDPGGDDSLPLDAESPPGTPQDGLDDDSDQGGAVEPEPAVDPDSRPIPQDGPEATQPTPGRGPPIAPAPAPPTTSPPSAPAAPPTPVTTQLEAWRDGDANRRTAGTQDSRGAGKARRKPRPKREARPAGAPATTPPAAEAPRTSAPAQTAEPAPQPPSAVQVAAATQRAAAPRRGSREHVVRPGESLWSIARGILGSDASMARVAREVNRLWDLNETRIATGDPDLLLVGTRLRLR